MNPDNKTPAKGDILIVDDDLPSLDTLSSMLTAEGFFNRWYFSYRKQRVLKWEQE